jgi:glutamyl-tRNA synthetase
MSDAAPARTRYAPSPTGFPHVGVMRTALYDWLLARKTGGQFILRFEDTDRERYVEGAEEALIDGLHWLGLHFDEGPVIGGPHAPYVQSERLPRYREVVEELIARGHAYRCYCTRERLQEIREARQKANIHPLGYDRHCRELSDSERRAHESSGSPHVVRFAIPSDGDTAFHDELRGTVSFPNRELDDHVLLKSDGFPTYHLAAMVDDHDMEITHAIRGEEWLPSTPRHVLFFHAMGWQTPKWVHPGVILGTDRKKLSKRHGALPVTDYRQQGYLPEALVNYLALLGWSPGGDRETMSAEEMVSLFSLDGVNASPSVFDLEKLNWMNGVYIRKLPESELLARCLPFLAAAGLVADPPADPAYVTRVLKLEQERLKRLDEAPQATEFFFVDPPTYDEAAVTKWLRKSAAREMLDAVLAAVEGVSAWEVEPIEAAVRGIMEARSVKPGEVVHPTRVAVTGRTVGPGLFETLHVLGRDRTLARLRNARERFTS